MRRTVETGTGASSPSTGRWVLIGLLAAVLIIGLYWGLATTRSEPGIEGATAPVGTVEPIASVAVIVAEPTNAELVGQQVTIESIPVADVVSDHIFWVSEENATTRVPVVLAGELHGTQPEAAVEVQDGQRVRITGVIKTLDEPKALSGGGLSEEQTQALDQAPLYISATEVQVLQ